MKTTKILFALIVLTGLLFIGCSDRSISPVQSNISADNSVSLQKGSSESGAWIVRYEASEWYYAFFDQDAGLFLTLGINDISKFCNYEGGFDVDNVKEIYLPNTDPDLRRMIDHEKADYTAMIWQTESLPADYRDFICNHEPMATGIVNFSARDNDYYAWLQDNKNSDSYGFKANGTLKGQDGMIYKLNLVYQFMWHGVIGGGNNEVFKLQLTPAG